MNKLQQKLVKKNEVELGSFKSFGQYGRKLFSSNKDEEIKQKDVNEVEE